MGIRNYGKTVSVIALLLISAAALFIYTRFNPEDSIFFPRCIFLSITGLQCPGCGSQRAVHQLLNGNIGAAFSQNALLVISIPYLILWAAVNLLYDRYPLARTLEQKLYHGNAVYVVLLFIISFGILRNII